MNKITLQFVVFLLGLTFLNAQIQTSIDTVFWESKNVVGIDISQIAFSNWNSGGNNTIAGLIKANFERNYKKDNIIWNNELVMRYGVNKQAERELRKTDDVFMIQSNFGFRKEAQSNWYYSGRFRFNTQFADGFNYPNVDNPISRLMAPGFLFLGVGSEYNRKDLNFSFYGSPFTIKTTFVWDQTLADRGAFGVQKAIIDSEGNVLQRGKRSRNEFGILLNSQWKTEVYKNMNLDTRLSLYSDYLNKFGNIDVDLQTELSMIVNEYVRATVGFHIMYDDDVQATKQVDGQQVTVGPKIQLKQMIAVGVVYEF